MIKGRPRPKYSVGLSTSGLSIRHDCPIKTIKDIFDSRHGDLFIGLLLLSSSIQNTIEVEVSHIIVWSCQCNRFVILYCSLIYNITYRVELNTLGSYLLSSL
jgi:hypothetical protein